MIGVVLLQVVRVIERRPPPAHIPWKASEQAERNRHRREGHLKPTALDLEHDQQREYYGAP